MSEREPMVWAGRFSKEQEPHLIRCAGYRGPERMMDTAVCTCGSLARYVTALTAELAQTSAERDVYKAKAEAYEAMREWTQTQIDGIRQSSIAEASRGALNAFRQVLMKLDQFASHPPQEGNDGKS